MTPRLPSRERQRELIDAAIELSATSGPGDITTAALAARVGISQGAVFRHFETKESLWVAVVDEVHRLLFLQLDLASEQAGRRPMDRLQAVFMAHAAYVVAHPGVPRILFHELQQTQETKVKARVRLMLQEYRLRILGMLQMALDEGDLPAGLDVQAAAALFIGALQGLVMQALFTGDLAQITVIAPRVHALWRSGLSSTTQPLKNHHDRPRRAQELPA
ncbi:MAG: TetR/AcrR family transcriptional regulator [Gammaproteobacteria bacterium]